MTINAPPTFTSQSHDRVLQALSKAVELRDLLR
jgi:hypothetical protein